MKSKQKTRAESVGKFVPSTGDEDYLKPAGSLAPIGPQKGWANNTANGAISLTTLDALATDIHKTVDATHKTIAKAQIKVGKLLLEARAEFPGDLEFGQWRKEKTPIKSQGAANDLMRVAKEFSNAPELVDKCSFSVLRELVYCPPEVVAGVKESIKQGIAPPTVMATRGMKNTAAGHPAGKTSKSIYDSKERDPEAEAIDLIRKPLLQRLNHKNPYVQLGLYPFGGPPHLDVLDAIEMWYEQVNDKDPDNCSDAQLDKIYRAVHAIVKEGLKK